MEVKSLSNITTVAKSMDDSFGESFDKVAKMMGLGYPGGPAIQNLAKDGDRKRYDFTVPLLRTPKFAFSYSGLKNAVRLAVESAQKEDYKDIAASFEHIATKHLTHKLKKYFQNYPPKTFAIVGGASANLYLRRQIQTLLEPYGAELLLSDLEYCSDNAAMIGRVAVDMYKAKMFSSLEELDVAPKSNL
jgi:N6-L-threonylcarbamoyladenine synthase